MVRYVNEGKSGVELIFDRRSADKIPQLKEALVRALKAADADVQKAFLRHTGESARRSWKKYVDEIAGKAADGYPGLDNLIKVIPE